MTQQEAIAYLESPRWSGWRLGLERIRELLRRLDDPQKSLRFVHVAGSNGKGSACAMLACILREAGYRTGFFPSPYIEHFRERIQISGEWISPEDLCALTEEVAAAADTMADHPTAYELVTALGLLYFARKQCDIVVLEAGLGGAEDATNVIPAPEAAVIMHIGLEHTQYLGSTLEEIASVKAGIIKHGADVISYDNPPSVNEVIRQRCLAEECPYHPADFSRIRIEEQSLSRRAFRLLPDDTVWETGLIGEHQIRNAAVVLETAHVLSKRGFPICPEAIKAGLKNTVWPARFEILSEDPLFILDGGHNPQCAEALAETVRMYLPEHTGHIVFMIGMLADKDVSAVVDLLIPYAQQWVCTSPASPRAMPAETLALQIRNKTDKTVLTARTIPEAVKTAVQCASGKPVIAFGSLYMAGQIRSLFKS